MMTVRVRYGPPLSVVIAHSSSPSTRAALERLDGLAEQRLGAVLQPLLGHAVDVLLAVDLREARDVEDVLLGVDRRDLAAELLEALDDAAARLAMAGVVRRREARGPGADDRDVDHGVLTHRGQASGLRVLATRPYRPPCAYGHHVSTAHGRRRTAAHPRTTHHRDRGASRGLDRREFRGSSRGADAARLPRSRHAAGRGRPRRHPLRRRGARARRGHGGADDHPHRGRPPGRALGGAQGARAGRPAGNARRARDGRDRGAGRARRGRSELDGVTAARRRRLLDGRRGGLRVAARHRRPPAALVDPRGRERAQRPVRGAARDRPRRVEHEQSLRRRRRTGAARGAGRHRPRRRSRSRGRRRLAAAPPAAARRPASRR